MKVRSVAIALALLACHVEAYVQQTRSTSQARTELFSSTVRKPFITGNWKMNPTTKQEAIDLATGIAESVTESSPGKVALFVPYPFLECVQEIVGDKLIVGAEAIIPQKSGAFTGGISPQMLKSMCVTWVLAGHSERRTLFKEDDYYINAQCRLLIENGMNVVLCIGETAEEYEKNLVKDVCEIQIKKGLAGLSAKELKQVTLAYEPVWAIGTSKVASPEIAQDVHREIRDILRRRWGHLAAERMLILYGGSVNADNVDGLLAKPDIDGALVGGASLDVASFSRIVNFEQPGQFAWSVRQGINRLQQMVV